MALRKGMTFIILKLKTRFVLDGIDKGIGTCLPKNKWTENEKKNLGNTVVRSSLALAITSSQKKRKG